MSHLSTPPKMSSCALVRVSFSAFLRSAIPVELSEPRCTKRTFALVPEWALSHKKENALERAASSAHSRRDMPGAYSTSLPQNMLQRHLAGSASANVCFFHKPNSNRILRTLLVRSRRLVPFFLSLSLTAAGLLPELLSSKSAASTADTAS